jgi:hypothetical protein
MKKKYSHNISVDFLNKINKINDLKNINKLELKKLIMIYIKMNSLFNINDEMLNMYLPYILYSSVYSKNNAIDEYNCM